MCINKYKVLFQRTPKANHVPFLFGYTLASFFFLYNLVKLIRRSISYAAPKLPPGQRKFPLIGNMLSMVSSEQPHHVLRNLARKHAPLMHLQLGEIYALVVSSPRVAKEILVKHDLAFASRPEILVSKYVFYNSNIAFSPYGNYWRQLRKICTLEVGTPQCQENQVILFIQGRRGRCAYTTPSIVFRIWCKSFEIYIYIDEYSNI